MNIKIALYFALSILVVLLGIILFPELGTLWIFTLFTLIFTIPMITIMILSIIVFISNNKRKERNV
jgi:hypothetical protein